MYSTCIACILGIQQYMYSKKNTMYCIVFSKFVFLFFMYCIVLYFFDFRQLTFFSNISYCLFWKKCQLSKIEKSRCDFLSDWFSIFEIAKIWYGFLCDFTTKNEENFIVVDIVSRTYGEHCTTNRQLMSISSQNLKIAIWNMHIEV